MVVDINKTRLCGSTQCQTFDSKRWVIKNLGIELKTLLIGKKIPQTVKKCFSRNAKGVEVLKSVLLGAFKKQFKTHKYMYLNNYVKVINKVRNKQPKQLHTWYHKG